MAGFSGTVRISDVSDFIAPSQSCVLNLDGSKKADEEPKQQPQVGTVQLQRRNPLRATSSGSAPVSGSGFAQVGPTAGAWGTSSTDQGAIKVTLNDCLACSGCVTSAETVLLEQQSTAELLAKLGLTAGGASGSGGTPPMAGEAVAAAGAASPATAGEKPLVVVSVSPQCRASLAALHGVPSSEVLRRLAHFFKALGAAYVFDLGAARSVSLMEEAREFVARYRHRHALQQQQQQQGGGGVAAAAAGGAANGARAESQLGGEGEPMDVDVDGGPSAGGGAPPGPLPMLAGACPGWVCYAEKTHGDAALPHIGAARSPQAVQGALVKRWLAPALGVPPGAVYHVALMPCYDKKLEAARADFEVDAVLPSSGSAAADGSASSAQQQGQQGQQQGGAVPEVDCVLTSVEVHSLLEARGVDLGAPATPGCAPDSLAALAAAAAAAARGCSQETLASPAAAAAVAAAAAAAAAAGAGGGVLEEYGYPGGSGGHLEAVARHAARELWGLELPSGPLPLRTLRNADMRELLLYPDGTFGGGGGATTERASGSTSSFPASRQAGGQQQQQQQQVGEGGARSSPALRFAAAYGFRNIQGLVRKVKRRALEYDYVEVMACPGGCNNGGGQLRAAGGETPAQVLERVEAAYHWGLAPREPDSDPAAAAVYAAWLGGAAPGSARARAALHTEYHRREKPAAAAIQDW